ncbi:mediator of DNA damage checkpoint protein 1 [Hippocampus comes]|uniref:mediator of DNA damage checkpoint protein 1 n=1 Tax=Hippocampus comes TaxID=109280 RepID=UPI00094E63EB|nr:PREDICTED: mediator of DNA damage checkpoint protein 1-like [Hippocampus comes]
MWWVVLVLLSCQDRELAVGAGVGPSRGRRSEDSGGPRGAEPLTRADEAERRGRFGDPPEATRRAKRGFTYPGTLWCGAGNMADHYDQLGEYEETDRCCRTHDHCPHVIHAFSSKYGHTNFKWHSISHCDCDEALKGCLRRANDTSSRVVGQAFFNVIGAPCFQLVYEERCAERRWYGPCKRYEKRPIAVVKEAVPYDYGGIAVIDVLTRAPPERKRETPTQATLSGPEEPSLGNTGAAPAAAEDFVKVLATVSTASAADSDKESPSSDGKRAKKKDRAEKKTKKRNGQKRRQKVVRVEGVATVLASGGKKAVEKVPSRNSVADQTATRRRSDGQSARSSDDVLKDEAPMGTGELRGTAGPTGAPPGSPPKTVRGEEKAPLAAPKEIPRLTNNLTAPLASHDEQRPGEEIPPPGVESADVSGVKFPWTAGEAGPPAGSRPKTGLPRKGRRKENARGIRPPAVDSTKSLPVIPTFRQRRPGEEISQAAIRSTGNLVMAEKSRPPAGSLSKTKRPRKGGRKDKFPATSPEEAPQLALDFTENRSATPLPANLTSQRRPSKQIPQPAGDFTDNFRVSSPTTDESAPPLWSLSRNRRPRKSRRKEKAFPTSAQEVAQPAVDEADDLRAVPTSRAQRRDPGEKRPRTHSAGAPGVSSALTVQIPKSAVRPTDLQSVLSIQVVPTSQQVPREEISQSAIDSKSSPSATSTPASQAQRGPASSGSTVQPVRQKPTVPGPPGTPEVKRNRSGERGDSEGRKKERKARPHPGAPSVTPAGPTQSRDIVPAVGIRKRQMSGRSAQRMKAASESVPLASLASSAAAADPFGSLARRTGPRKLGRNAALVNAHRGFATSEFPNLTSAPEEGAEKRRAGVSAARLASAVRRSMERAEERFAWKKRRKATGSIRPH